MPQTNRQARRSWREVLSDLHGRAIRLVEALEDGDQPFALTLACDLERQITVLRSEGERSE
jgi:hypothetical protein